MFLYSIFITTNTNNNSWVFNMMPRVFEGYAEYTGVAIKYLK